jgi:hypothetical protein
MREIDSHVNYIIHFKYGNSWLYMSPYRFLSCYNKSNCMRGVFFLKKIVEQSLLEAMYTNDDGESGMLDFIRSVYQSFSYT